MANLWDDLEQEALNPRKPNAPGVVSDISRATGQFVAGLGSTLRDLGAEQIGAGVEKYGTDVVLRNPSKIKSFQDILDNPLTTLREAVSEVVPQVGLAVGGRLAGRAIGGALGAPLGPLGVIAGQQIGGVVGGLAPIAAQTYGGIRSEQRAQGIEDIPRAIGVTIPAAALERFGGAERIAGRVVGEGTQFLARKAGQRAVPFVARQFARGGLEEAITEVPQSALERFGAYAPVTGPEAVDDYAVAATKAFLGGGAVRGGLSAFAGQRQTTDLTTGKPSAETPEQPPLGLTYSPLAGTPVVFPDGTVALGSEQELAKRYNLPLEEAPASAEQDITAPKGAAPVRPGRLGVFDERDTELLNAGVRPTKRSRELYDTMVAAEIDMESDDAINIFASMSQNKFGDARRQIASAVAAKNAPVTPVVAPQAAAPAATVQAPVVASTPAAAPAAPAQAPVVAPQAAAPAAPVTPVVAPSVDTSDNALADLQAAWDTADAVGNEGLKAEIEANIEELVAQRNEAAGLSRDREGITEDKLNAIIQKRFAKSKNAERDAQIMTAYMTALRNAPKGSSVAVQEAIGKQFGIGAQAVRKIGNPSALVAAGKELGYSTEQVLNVLDVDDNTKAQFTHIGQLEAQIKDLRKQYAAATGEAKTAIANQMARANEEIQRAKDAAEQKRRAAFSAGLQKAGVQTAEGETAGFGFDTDREWAKVEASGGATTRIIQLSDARDALRQALEEFQQVGNEAAVAETTKRIADIDAQLEKFIADASKPKAKAAEKKPKKAKTVAAETAAEEKDAAKEAEAAKLRAERAAKLQADRNGLAVGDTVKNPKLGTGVVKRFAGDGDSTTVTVAFQSGQTKELSVKLAKLEKVDAVQVQGAAGVPVQPEARAGQEVGRQVRRAEEPAAEGQAQGQVAVRTTQEQYQALTAGFEAPAFSQLTERQQKQIADLAGRDQLDLAALNRILGVEGAKFGKDIKAAKAENPYTAKELLAELKDFIRADIPGRKLFVVNTIEDLLRHPDKMARAVGASIALEGAYGVASNGRAYLVADRIQKGSGRAKFMHEVGAHLGLENLLPKAQYDKLTQQIVNWAKKDDGSIESELATLAAERVMFARTPTDAQRSELLAYFIEEAVQSGIDPTANVQQSGPLRDWFRALWSAFNVALRKLGLKPEAMTAKDVVDLAFGAARVEIDGRFRGMPTAFKEWFGDSKVVEKDGAPMVVYHGTNKDFEEFDIQRSGSSSGQYLGRGFYFARSPGVADAFAGGDAARIIPAYLSMQNPFYTDATDLTEAQLKTLRDDGTFGPALAQAEAEAEGATFGSWFVIQRAAVLSKNRASYIQGALEKLGYDGVISGDLTDGDVAQSEVELVVFRPEQIKSAIGNKGRYGRDDARMQFGRDPRFEGLPDALDPAIDEKDSKGTWGSQSKLDRALRLMDRADKAKDPAVADNLRAQAEKLMSEAAAGMAKGDKRMRFGKAAPAARKRLIDRNVNKLPQQLRQPANNIVGALGDLMGRGLDYVVFTSDLVGRAVQAGMPAAQRFATALANSKSAASERERRVEKIADMYATIEEANKGSGPGSANEFLFESTRTGKWGYGKYRDAKMGAMFDALGPKAQAFVKAVFQHGDTMLSEKKKIVLDAANSEYDAMIAIAKRDGDKNAEAKLKAEKVATLKRFDSLFKIREGLPYAPIKRSGSWAVVSRSPEYQAAVAANDTKRVRELEQNPDHYQVSFVDSKWEARTLQAKIDQEFAGLSTDIVKRAEAMDDFSGKALLPALTSLRAKVDAERGTANTKVHNIISQLYLEALAEDSARKSEMRRRGISGEVDMLSSFTTQGRADANFLASVEYSPEIQDALQQMRSQSKTGDVTRKTELFDEISSRYTQSLDYNVNPWVDKLTSLSSKYFLATSPGYYLQNLTQPFMMSVPAMAGRHDYAKVGQAMWKAYSELGPLFKNTKLFDQQFDFTQVPADVRAAVDELVKRGKIDIGLATEINEFKVDADNKLSQFAQRLNKGMRMAVQKAEAVNRLSTAMAAYRLELAKSGSKDKAIEYADRILTETHGDYTAFNAPRIFNSNFGKIALQFRKFQLIQIAFYVKLFRDFFTKPDERAAALRTLGYSLAHSGVFAGALGLPGYAAVAALAGMFGGDDDEKFDLTEWMRKELGPEWSQLVMRGVPTLAGVDLSGKIGAGQMLSIAPFADIDLTTQAGVTQAIGTIAGGATGGMAARMLDGLGLIMNGDIYRGTEQVMPKGIGDMLKAGRISGEGLTRRNGDVILSDEDVSQVGQLFAAIGLPSVKVTETYQARQSALDLEKNFTERATKVKNQYAKAFRERDTEAMAEAREAWKKLQDARKRNDLKPQPMSSLLRAPQEQRKREQKIAEQID